MATIAFDTLKYTDKLKAAGISDSQARAEAEALQAAFSDALDSQLATKTDIMRIERRMDGLDAKIDKLDAKLTGELTLVKWMMGLILGGVVALFLRAFFPAS